MSINDRIASFVNSKKIKKGELATLLDITPQTISNILGGKVNPSSSFLIGIATKFYDLAENILFRSIITGISMRPLEAILRDGKPIIEAEYKRLQKVYEDVDVFIDELG